MRRIAKSAIIAIMSAGAVAAGDSVASMEDQTLIDRVSYQSVASLVRDKAAGGEHSWKRLKKWYVNLLDKPDIKLTGDVAGLSEQLPMIEEQTEHSLIASGYNKTQEQLNLVEVGSWQGLGVTHNAKSLQDIKMTDLTSGDKSH